MRYALTLAAAIGLGATSLYACSPSSGNPTPAPTTEGGAPDSGKPTRDAGDGSVTKPPRTEGISCATAIPVNLSTSAQDATDGEFVAAGESYYYKVDLPVGAYLIFSAATEVKADSAAGEFVDTGIKVFNAAGTTLLASVDDSYPRVNTDAELIHRAAAAGTVCVQVTDFDTWSGKPNDAKLAPQSAFKFSVLNIGTGGPAASVDVGPNDTIATAQVGKLTPFTNPAAGKGGFGFVFGYLNDAADVDVYKFVVPAETSSISVSVPPIGAPLADGKSSYGSTMARFTATIKKPDGTIISQVSPPPAAVEKMTDELTGVVAPGDYYLEISRPAGVAAGANDFYTARVIIAKGNDAELETAVATNNTLATAQALTQVVNANNAKVKNAFVAGALAAGDIADNFSVQVAVGDTISVVCGAARNGSGLIDFKAELFVAGTSAVSEVETLTQDLVWAGTAIDPQGFNSKVGYKVTTAGTAVLQLTAANRSTTNTGYYYLCGFSVTSP